MKKFLIALLFAPMLALASGAAWWVAQLGAF